MVHSCEYILYLCQLVLLGVNSWLLLDIECFRESILMMMVMDSPATPSASILGEFGRGCRKESDNPGTPWELYDRSLDSTCCTERSEGVLFSYEIRQ